MDTKTVESFRSPYENDNEWNLRKKFLENNSSRFPTDRLVCLSMCYINNVSYGVTYSPGVMSQLKECAQGLPSHMDIVKEKNNIAFVKAEPKANGCKYGNFVKSEDTSDDNNSASNTKPTEASYPKTSHQLGAGLGFGNAGGAGLGFGNAGGAGLGFGNAGGAGLGFKTAESTDNSPNTNSSMNSTKYPGFVKSGSTGSQNPTSCFSTTDNVTKMFNHLGFSKSGSNVSPTENSNTSSNNNNHKYMKMMKSTPNSHVGNQANMLSSKYRSKPLLKAPQESPRPHITSPPPAKKALLKTRPKPAATLTSSSQESGSAGNIEVTYLEKKFYALSDCLKEMKISSINAIQILNMAITKVKLLIDSDTMPFLYNTSTIFRCKVRIAEVQVGEGMANNKKTAKHEAFSKALDVLVKPTLKIENQNGQQVLVGSDVPQQGKMTVLKSAGPNPSKKTSSWGHFLIMENKSAFNAVAVIRHSADFNKMSVEYVFAPTPQGSVCRLLINDEPIVDCVSENKMMAKLAVAEKGLEWLKERCWTIMIKQTADSDMIDVTRDKIMGEIEKQFKPIGSDNIGNQLLRKMGWEGGGIGAEGNTGIAEPITVNQVIDRQGLGCRSTSGVSTKFDAQIRDILLRYVKSKKQQDLVFTSEFNKDERAIIHKEARRYNLKSISRGSGEERYMIISRKRSAGQLFNHILSSGGSTQKYQLIPPLKK